MDIAQLLALAHEGDGAVAVPAPNDTQRHRRRLTQGGRTLLQCRRGLEKKRKLKRSFRQLSEQVQRHNTDGRARTHDHLIMPPGVLRPSLAGAGQWKRWTIPAVCKAAFLPPATTLRGVQAAIGSGSHLHAARCRDVISQVIVDAQVRGLKRLCRPEAGGHHAVIVNNMFDETKLPVDMGLSLIHI